MRIIFLQIKNNKEKLLKLVQRAHFHFQANEKFLIITHDVDTANYVDKLLWKVPLVSFLPHSIQQHSTNEKIVISSKKENLNQSNYIFNLCPTPLLWDNAKVIYEYEDFTHPGKQMLSRKKYEAYKERKYFIESNLS